MRYGMVIDLNMCVGCYACVIKCKQEHFLPPDMTWAKLLITETGIYPDVIKHAYPLVCNHCKDAACIEACPTGATSRREDGIVWVDQEKCTGCKNCVDACPYQMRTFYPDGQDYFRGQGSTGYEALAEKLYPLKNDIVVKCNFCADRIDEGTKKGLKPGVDLDATPACVNICPAKARFFGDLDNPESEVSKKIEEKDAVQLHPGYGTDPSVYYVYSGAMPESRLISHSSFPASVKYSLPLFLTTARQVHQSIIDEDAGKAAQSTESPVSET